MAGDQGEVNADLATHISLLAAPIFAALLARADPPDMIADAEWQEMAMKIALALARKLWDGALAA